MSELSSMRVLVVDDVETNVDILVETLGDDYRVSVAMDGESALETIAKIPPDLILLDIMMPGIDGYGVCKRLKADPATRDIPVVFLTALAEENDEAKGLSLGAVDYITKPFRSELLKARVHNHLELKRHKDHLKSLVNQQTQERLLTQEVTLENTFQGIIENKEEPMGKDYLKKETVMVVDDCEADLDALVECLGGEYRVKVAMDGDSALEDIKKNMPDIILLDVLMPGIDGFEVCRRIKQNKETKDALVIFVTALTEQIDETKGLELGAIDYITKPFNFAIIRAKVNTHLELVKARKDLKRQNEILRENMELREQVEQISRHDLRNPLQIILGYAQLLGMEPPLEKAERGRIIENQISACDTMADIINRTMDLYKMEKGIYDLDVKQVDIMPLLDQLLLGLKHLIQSKSIRVMVNLNKIPRKTDDTFIIPCDEVLFYSMMSNLLKNAIEASPEEEKIDLSFVKNELITIHIQNRGTVHSGIRNRFFEKFISFGKRNGTGLGTYSARLMAELHGGGLTLDTSDRENKTTLSIHLPKLE